MYKPAGQVQNVECMMFGPFVPEVLTLDRATAAGS